MPLTMTRPRPKRLRNTLRVLSGALLTLLVIVALVILKVASSGIPSILVEWIADRCSAAGDHFNIVDGSGVSLYNYVSPKLMLEYLKYAYYHRPVFLPLYESLPIAGVDGT